jgi:hypothetical protein
LPCFREIPNRGAPVIPIYSLNKPYITTLIITCTKLVTQFIFPELCLEFYGIMRHGREAYSVEKLTGSMKRNVYRIKD